MKVIKFLYINDKKQEVKTEKKDRGTYVAKDKIHWKIVFCIVLLLIKINSI